MLRLCTLYGWLCIVKLSGNKEVMSLFVWDLVPPLQVMRPRIKHPVCVKPHPR